jgi:orotate phosphoribosyltransferase
MNDTDRLTSLLAALLTAQSVRRGDFVLSSGRKSDLYIDARMTTMDPRGLALIGPLGLAAITAADWRPDSVGGLTLGADPVAYAIAYASAATDHPIRAFTVRKEAKTHGTGKLIEGPFVAGDRVVVIEDSITSGASALKAAAAAQAQGGQIVGVLAIVDREEGGRDAIEAAGFPLRTLVTRAALVSTR